MDEYDQTGWVTPWPGACGQYGPYLSPLEAYAAQRWAESLDRVSEDLEAARQAREDQRQAIRESLERARLARQAQADPLQEQLSQASGVPTEDPAAPHGPTRQRSQPFRCKQTVSKPTGERLDEPANPGLWSVDDLVPPVEAELVDGSPEDQATDGERCGE